MTEVHHRRGPRKVRAAVLKEHGGRFHIAEIDAPHLSPGHVAVRIKASGMNPLDLKIANGEAAHARHPLPAILGIDLAGVVESVGSGVAQFRAGDEVYGMTGGVGGLQGSLAELAVVDAALLALKPASISMREAAVLPLSFITAWEGLVDRAQVLAHQKVLIHGAGGVGYIAIQLARSMGAEVYATDSISKVSFIGSLGATPIDRHSDVEAYVASLTQGKGFDVIFDTVGGKTLDASFRSVSRFGHVVSALGWGTHSLAPLSFRAASYSGIFTLLPLLTGEGRAHHGEILYEAAKLVDARKLRIQLDPRHFTLATIDEAYAAMRGSKAGKVVVDIDA
jgi:NADPH:quinone reductase